MSNIFENVGQDIDIESVDSFNCYLWVGDKSIKKFTGETCYQDAQRMGMDILMKRIYGND
jgi:hypothetical protein